MAVPDELGHAVARTLRRARATGLGLLAQSGQLRPAADSELPSLSLPPTFRAVLEVTMAEASRSGREDHARALALQYAYSLPLALVLQQGSCATPNEWLFHGPVRWGDLERFDLGLRGLFSSLASAGLDANEILGAPDPAAWTRRFDGLGELYASTYFGACFPMFRAHQHDLVALQAEAEAAPPGARWRVVDRRLGAALLHELLHFGREREALFPPYLDEALAGYLGVRLLRETAYPEPGDDNALEGFPWFAQVGQGLVRAFGLGPVLAAQTGAVSWSSAIGHELVEALTRLGWRAYLQRRPLHFHPDTTRPERWVRLFYAAAKGLALDVSTIECFDDRSMGQLSLDVVTDDDEALEREMLEHALAAMCLAEVERHGLTRVVTAAPDGPVELDFEAGLARVAKVRAGAPDPPPRHVLPPGLCGARLALGDAAATATITDPHPDAVAELAGAIRSGPLDASGAGWRLQPANAR